MQRRTALVKIASPIDANDRWRSRRGRAPGILTLLLGGDWIALKSGNNHFSYRVNTSKGSFFVEIFRPTAFLSRIRDFVFLGKPQKAYVLGLLLLDNGVATPLRLGLFSKGLFVCREFMMVSEWLEKPTSLASCLVEEIPRALNPEEFKKALKAAAQLLGRLHRLGLRHENFVDSLLFAGKEPNRRPFLVNLEFLRSTSAKEKQLKNLEELNRKFMDSKVVTAWDKWFFLEAYVRTSGLGIGLAREFWREIRAVSPEKSKIANFKKEEGS